MKEHLRKNIESHCELIPPHMRDAVIHYVCDGVPPGGFLTALLSNDLMGAFGKADSTNIDNMKNWVIFIYNYLPQNSHGSAENIIDWCHYAQNDFRQEIEDDLDGI